MSERENVVGQPSRFVVGIDLGTTNCSVGFVDTSEAEWRVRDFLVAQLVAANTVEAREVLPSFHYERAEGEAGGGAVGAAGAGVFEDQGDASWGGRGRRS